MAETTLKLFGGPHCGLCEQALDLVSPLVTASYSLHQVDVTTNLELKKQYGLKIPVLRREDTGAELHWPFDAEQLALFLNQP